MRSRPSVKKSQRWWPKPEMTSHPRSIPTGLENDVNSMRSIERNKPKWLNSACGLFTYVASIGLGGREVGNLCNDKSHGRHCTIKLSRALSLHEFPWKWGTVYPCFRHHKQENKFRNNYYTWSLRFFKTVKTSPDPLLPATGSAFDANNLSVLLTWWSDDNVCSVNVFLELLFVFFS